VRGICACALVLLGGCFDLDALRSHDLGPPDLGGCVQVNQSLSAPSLSWMVKQDANYDGGNQRLQLTKAQPGVTGGAFFSTPVSVSAFDVAFDYYVGQSSPKPGNGLAFVLLTSMSLGSSGEIGFTGQTGFAVTVIPYDNAVGFKRAMDNATLVEVTPPPSIVLNCDCTRHLHARFTGTHISVDIDATPVLDSDVSGFVPGSYFMGFTAATGTSYEVAAVKNLSVIVGPPGNCF
jgi:hypothetical protein